MSGLIGKMERQNISNIKHKVQKKNLFANNFVTFRYTSKMWAHFLYRTQRSWMQNMFILSLQFKLFFPLFVVK